jgi:hypothetical protein
MSKRQKAAGLLAGITAMLIFAPTVAADTCCANTSVVLHPATARPGDSVRVDGIACLNYDNSGPLALNVKSFWLSADDVPADADPGSAPGSGLARLANDLPPVEQWLPFASVPDAGQVRIGAATIVVPDVPRGSYQLWWLCDNGGGPGSGIHYSDGPRLKVDPGSPDTATVDPAPARSPASPAALLVAIGLAAGFVTLCHVPVRRRHPGSAPAGGSRNAPRPPRAW